MGTENKLDFVQGASFLPWDWRNLGAVFGRPKNNTQCVAARCNFAVRRGYDIAEKVDYGRVLEGLGDLGLSLRSKHYAFHVSAGNLTYKTGNDEPLRAQSVLGNALSSLKLTFAQEYSEDQYLAVSYDIKQRKPEISLAWSGETFTEKATVAMHLDPVDRALRIGAGISLPGPEWRDEVYDEETDKVEYPEDDGARHTLFVQHEMRRRNLLSRTRVGARLDVGRLVNYAADFVDYRLEHRIPGIFWWLPFSQRLYNLVIPAEDEKQVRHHIKGWQLELAHDFEKAAPEVGLSKAIGSGAFVAGYDFPSKTAGLEFRHHMLRAGVHMGRTDEGWKNPSLLLSIEPLACI
eukprot:jgi/Chrzof1/12414/Cz06g33180.t1